VSILEGIMGLLIVPNPDDPLVASIAEMYQKNRYSPILGANNRKLFDKMAKDYVKKYAM
jgi:ubiquitin-protein ligase